MGGYMYEILPRKVRVNLRQTGSVNASITTSMRVRKSPYWHLTRDAGARSYSVHNHMYSPQAYESDANGGLLKEYQYLTQSVVMWDGATQRQIQIKGNDAAEFVDAIITRDVPSLLPVGSARLALICNARGGILNTPVVLRVAEDEFWLSTSDSDVLLWAQGTNGSGAYDVAINEIDVAPLQVQGPRSSQLMAQLFGDHILNMPYYSLIHEKLEGTSVVVSRTGFSAEIGFEIYPMNATVNAEKIWNRIMEVGKQFDLHVIAPSEPRRIEAGILLYGQDMDIENNPYEVGLGWLVDVTKQDFIGKQPLTQFKALGVAKQLAAVVFGGNPIKWYNEDFYFVSEADSGYEVGYMTSAFYSPAWQSNIGFAMVESRFAQQDTKLQIELPGDGAVAGEVVRRPFVDPRKTKPFQKLTS
jgi:glycine cleavage system aminomethyltransferase T